MLFQSLLLLPLLSKDFRLLQALLGGLVHRFAAIDLGTEERTLVPMRRVDGKDIVGTILPHPAHDPIHPLHQGAFGLLAKER